MAFPPQFLDELREKIPLSELIGRKVKLTHKGREYTGLCPFHKEKTPSFTVNDDKGFYHCFGCGAHGDIVRFLTESEKMPFIEAVEYLANMAGMKMPELSHQQSQIQKQQSNLLKIMETACQFFQSHLFSSIGTEAKNYLVRRGMSSDMAKRFRLGYAPTGQGLFAHLSEKGFNAKDCLSLGLIAKNRDGNGYHDYFYDRVMFPVMNKRGHVIGFSGRMLHQGEPKYLNSPETDLFHKGELLYGLPQALETVRKQNEALVVEGNMDVISLHGAGFTQAMAPLGTAFTEDQIKLLWTMCDEPVICFDGDGAGQKAMMRAVKRALPILRPGKSLRFAYLPNGFDPDDMIRKKSPAAFEEELKSARPFVEALWQMLLEGRTLNTPERKAKLEQDTKDTVALIQDASVRTYYQQEMAKKIRSLTFKKSKNKQTLTANLTSPTQSPQLLAYLIAYPEQGALFAEDLMRYMPTQDTLNTFADVIAYLTDTPDLTYETLWEKLSEDQQNFLQNAVDNVHSKQLDAETVLGQLQTLINMHKRTILAQEIADKNKLYLETENPAIKEEINTLNQELHALMHADE
ncbi:MAG: DNA primase [Alphaproteobacteria bacterium]|nr:DNA primase [Alphaproteobacteria bacterium]